MTHKDAARVLKHWESWDSVRLPGHNVTALELLEPENARHEGVAIAGLHRALKDTEAPVEEKDLLSTLKNWAVPMAKEAIGLLEHLQEL